MAFDKDTITRMINEGAEKVQKAAADTKESVIAHYRSAKLTGELEDLYIELGKMVNEAYNTPGSRSESEVAALNDAINQKAQEVAAARAAFSGTSSDGCPSCGKNVKEGYVFCPFCGQGLDGEQK